MVTPLTGSSGLMNSIGKGDATFYRRFTWPCGAVFENFEARCSLRTWVYRVAHNVAASYVIRQRRTNVRLLSLEEMDSVVHERGQTEDANNRMDLERLLELIHQLNPPDRELMLLYLEDLDAAAIGEIMGLSSVNVRSKIHRIKMALSRRFHAGGRR